MAMIIHDQDALLRRYCTPTPLEALPGCGGARPADCRSIGSAYAVAPSELNGVHEGSKAPGV
jgi:hypothetical protein